MDKNKKNLLRISVSLNVLFLLVVIWGFSKMNYVTERILFNEVQMKLLMLEDAIVHQKENNWSQPSLITQGLGDVINGIGASANIGVVSKTLTKNKIKKLNNLRDALLRYHKYPIDTQYAFEELSEKDKENYEKLGDNLLKVGFGKRMEEGFSATKTATSSKYIETILNEVEELTELLNKIT